VDEAREQKTLIGILASHDSPEKNNALAKLLDELCAENEKLLSLFHFLFTGGTYERIIIGTNESKKEGVKTVNDRTREILIPNSTTLPSRKKGGVTILAYSVVQRSCNIIWPFLSPVTAHWLNPENLALMRLSDQWHVKRLMNSGSVTEWFKKEAEMDTVRNLCAIPLELDLPGTDGKIPYKDRDEGGYKILSPKDEDFREKNRNEKGYKILSPKDRDFPDDVSFPDKIKDMTIALIAHDDMKARMIEFVLDYERELNQFERILATGTTGRDVIDASRILRTNKKVFQYHSGPKGGDIEIATEVLYGRCHVVVFFIDPLHPHPHIEDIRVVFGACMIQDEVRMLTNDMQARDWMERIVRRAK